MRGLLTTGVCVLGMAMLSPLLLAAGNQPWSDVATRARGAERVVVGRVSEVHSSFGRNQHGDLLIMSRVVLEVEDTWKGAESATLALEMEGGTVGDLTLTVSDMPQLRQGQRGVFFLERSGPEQFVPRDRGHGVMKIGLDDRIEGSQLKLADVKSLVASARR